MLKITDASGARNVRDSESFKIETKKLQKQIIKMSGLITQQAQNIVSTSNDLYLLRKQINLKIHIF